MPGVTVGVVVGTGGVATVGAGKEGVDGGVVLFGVLGVVDVKSLLAGVVAADIVSVEPVFDCVASCDAVVVSRLQPSINTPPKSSTWKPKTQRTATLNRARPLVCCSSIVPCGMSGLELFIVRVALISVLSCEVVFFVYGFAAFAPGFFLKKPRSKS